MKFLLLSLFFFCTFQGSSQVNLPKDSIVSVLLVSHYHSIDKPIINRIKRNQDIIYFINIQDKEMYGFIDHCGAAPRTLGIRSSRHPGLRLGDVL